MSTPFEIITARLVRASKPFTSKDGTSVRACCPSCGGENRSKLIVTEKPSGNVLLFCFGGCGAVEVVDALGLDISNLFVDQPKRSKSVPASGRHDQRTLTSAAMEVIMEAEFILLCHAIDPVPGIAGALLEKAEELVRLHGLMEVAK